MSELTLQRVGPTYGGTGTASPLRGTIDGAQVVTDGHGRYFEAVRTGNVYTLQTKSATVTATTDISPLPATTGRALIGLINPPTSGKSASILKVGISTISGTPGGPFYIDVLPNSLATLSPGTPPTNCLTLAAQGSGMIGVSAAVPAQTAVARMLRPIGGPAAIAAGAGMYHMDEEIAGAVSVPPGALLAVTAHAVGTTHVVSLYLTWEELPAVLA
jgi:hypothetical protein